MIINHQVTTPAPQPSLGIRLEHLASESEQIEHWISRGQAGLSAALDAKRDEYTKLVEDNLPDVMELIHSGYVLPWSPRKVKDLIYKGTEAIETQIESEEHAECVAANDELVLGVDPMADDDPSHGYDYLDEAEAMQRSYDARAEKAERIERDVNALHADSQWTEATKHLDAVAAFVAQGTHNPRAYARAQSRFIGSILKLTQNHMEDTISKAVEDRFALLSHDGIEDTQVLGNRVDLLRAAVNEVFQNPDMNDVVGRDTVGL